MALKSQLPGSRVLLTGATGGLGQVIARSLKAAGAELILTGRRVDVLERIAADLEARHVAADLGRPDDVRMLLDASGPIDILIANAGLPAGGSVLDFSVADLDNTIAVNLRAPIVMARQAAEAMLERRGGHIVFVGSIGGRLASRETPVYNATKFGLRGFALSMREDLRDSGVKVSLVEPGFVRDVGMFADSGAQLPAGLRTISPQRVADAVLRAIRDNIAETVVAPAELRMGVALGGIAPTLSSRIQRIIGFDLNRNHG